MKVKELLDDAFDGEVSILKNIQSGYRCQTYLIENNNNKYIFQIYENETKYQARKKHNILSKIQSNYIPKVIKYKDYPECSYLITEWIEGETLTKAYNNGDFQFNNIASDLSKVLAEIHKNKENVFGWITDNSILRCVNFKEYIVSEYKRLIKELEFLESEKITIIKGKVEKAIDLIEERTNKKTTSELCWYDINPDNILVKKKCNQYTLSGLIDPGGARYGLKEWDFAYLKMDTLKTKEEYELLLTQYETNFKEKVDRELVDALSVIVELNDIAFMITENVKLPKPFESNFMEKGILTPMGTASCQP